MQITTVRLRVTPASDPPNFVNIMCNKAAGDENEDAVRLKDYTLISSNFLTTSS